jgi:hypothetical protein
MALLEEVVLSIVIMNSVPVSKQINEKREKRHTEWFIKLCTRTVTGTPAIV